MNTNNNETQKKSMVDKNDEKPAFTIQKSRREFIQKSLKRTVGVYVGMAMVDAFTGPKLNIGGMPLAAASTGIGVDSNTDTASWR